MKVLILVVIRSGVVTLHFTILLVIGVKFLLRNSGTFELSGRTPGFVQYKLGPDHRYRDSDIVTRSVRDLDGAPGGFGRSTDGLLLKSVRGGYSGLQLSMVPGEVEPNNLTVLTGTHKY